MEIVEAPEEEVEETETMEEPTPAEVVASPDVEARIIEVAEEAATTTATEVVQDIATDIATEVATTVAEDVA